jgi:hypothetical protein
MTTKVTVDAHAGWPVIVTIMRGEANSEKFVETSIVEPLTVKDFYIHSGLKILHIEEGNR